MFEAVGKRRVTDNARPSKSGPLLLYLLTTFAFLSITVATAFGQQARTPRPVDQAVEDLDITARSLRQVETGLGAPGQHTQLFSAGYDDLFEMPVYYRVEPGFVARVNRIDYLVVNDNELRLNEAPDADGQFIELIPPNTVFELRTFDEIFAAQAASRPATRPIHQLDNQLDNQLDFLLDHRADAPPMLIAERLDFRFRPAEIVLPEAPENPSPDARPKNLPSPPLFRPIVWPATGQTFESPTDWLKRDNASLRLTPQ